MITIGDIARRAGVSEPAVSLVLNGRWKERRIAVNTKDRILKAAQELDYRPNRLASGLRSQKSNLIGLVVREFCHPLFTQINQAVVNELERRDYKVLLTEVPEFDDSERVEELYAHQIESLIMGPFYESVLSPFLAQLAARRFPLVAFFETSAIACDSVTMDREDAGYQAARHLIAQGHRRIGCIVSRASHPIVNGYRRAMTEAGLAIRPEWLIARRGFAELGIEIGQTIGIGDPHPTAYTVRDDLVAAGLIRACCDRRLRVPQDIAVVGYGDGPLVSLSAISISTIRVPVRPVAEAIVGFLMARLEKRPVEGWQKLAFKGELVVRESSATRNATT